MTQTNIGGVGAWYRLEADRRAQLTGIIPAPTRAKSNVTIGPHRAVLGLTRITMRCHLSAPLMTWSKERFLAAFHRGLPTMSAIRCGLAYMLSRLVWITARHHFQQSASEMLTSTLYVLVEAGIFAIVLSVSFPRRALRTKKPTNC